MATAQTGDARGFASASSGSPNQIATGSSLVIVSNNAVLATDAALTIFKQGALRLAGGVVSNGATIAVRGVLEGDGLIRGAIETSGYPQGGFLRPGGSNGVGRLTVVGQISQALPGNYPPAGVIEIELGGTTPRSGYDQMVCSNAVTLKAGTVTVSTINGFKPPLGTTHYDVITGSSVSTNGTIITLPPGGNGLTWSATLADIAGGRKALRVTSVKKPLGTMLVIK